MPCVQQPLYLNEVTNDFGNIHKLNFQKELMVGLETFGDEVAQRGVSDAESIEGDEVREPRRRNSPSDPTSREIEDHVLTGHASFRS